MIIAVLGGTKGFGKWLVDMLHQHFPAQEIRTTGSNDDNKIAVRNADIIIIAVPINKTVEIIREIGPHVSPHAIVADVTSIKTPIVAAMESFLPQSCIKIPCHPMFGPFVQNVAGQVFVFTPSEETKKHPAYTFLLSFLQQQNAKCFETTPEKHDQMMAVVQGMTHFVLFVVGETMKRCDVDLAFAEQLVSPVYKLLTSTVARYVQQNPRLYADIQLSNPEIPIIHATFMEVCQHFTSLITRHDVEGFVQTVMGTKEYFGPYAEQGQQYTDKIIYLMGEQHKKINEKIGKECVFKNIYTQEEKKGILTAYDGKTVTFASGENFFVYEWVIA